MKYPKSIVVNYIRIGKDGKHVAQSMGFAYDPRLSILGNIDSVLGFVDSIHSLFSIGSVVFKY